MVVFKYIFGGYFYGSANDIQSSHLYLMNYIVYIIYAYYYPYLPPKLIQSMTAMVIISVYISKPHKVRPVVIKYSKLLAPDNSISIRIAKSHPTLLVMLNSAITETHVVHPWVVAIFLSTKSKYLLLAITMPACLLHVRLSGFHFG